MISHLYFTKLRLKNLFDLRDSFGEYENFNLNEDTIDTLSADIVFIEIGKIDKSSITILNNIVKRNSTKEIFLYCEDIEEKFLLKFALHFSLNRLHLLEEDKSSLENTLLNVSKKLIISKEEKSQLEINRKINTLFALMIFNNSRLVFANEKAKQLLNADRLSDLEDIISNSEKIYSLINKGVSTNTEVVMKNSSGEEWSYNLFLSIFENRDDKLLTIIPQHRLEPTQAFLSTTNRLKFIEILKDALAQNAVEQTSMALVCINISNYSKLVSAIGNIATHNFMKIFIEKLYSYKNSSEDISQWNQHFFLFLIQEESFETVKQHLDSVHQKLIYSEIDKKFSPVIVSSAFNISGLDINDVIESIEQVCSYEFNSNTFNSSDYFEINHLNNYLKESEQIDHYLQSCIANQTKLKLLNIYKGLCINTASKILKIKDGSYFMHCENLQAYSMKFDNRTIIQSPDLSKDIEADIKYINIEKQYAIVENLNYLELSANNREHTRVQPSMRTPLTLRYGKYSYQGDILDISTRAIAIKFNHSSMDELNHKEVELQFKLLDSSMGEGFVNMDISGEVVHIGEIETTKSKAVVMVKPESPYDSYLLKYMYDRQKELILELKRATKLHLRT